jgi:ketosteroid isomerase-like protein
MAGVAQENEAVIRRGYESFNSGNMEELGRLFSEDIVWHAGGRGRLAGEKRGREATFAYFGQLAELSGGTFRAELHDVVAGDEHVAGVHTNTGERNGKRLNLHEVLLFHLRDGKVVEAWEHYEDSQVYDEFFA